MKSGNRTLTLEGLGKIPPIEFRRREDGHVELRYMVGGRDHPGFDGEWRLITEAERREHLRLGGRIAEWLLSQRAQGLSRPPSGLVHVKY